MFDVLRLAQLAGPSAGCQLPGGMRRCSRSIGKERNFFHAGFMCIIAADAVAKHHEYGGKCIESDLAWHF